MLGVVNSDGLFWTIQFYRTINTQVSSFLHCTYNRRHRNHLPWIPEYETCQIKVGSGGQTKIRNHQQWKRVRVSSLSSQSKSPRGSESMDLRTHSGNSS